MGASRYPLLFTYTDILAGNGFVAGVQVRGRSLMVEESEGAWWIYGVNPGGISAGGASQKEAASAFRSMYKLALFDIANDAASFDQMREEVTQFFEDTNRPTSDDWWQAVKLVRQGKLELDWLEKQKAESERGVKLVELVPAEQQEIAPDKLKPQPKYNHVEHDALAA